MDHLTSQDSFFLCAGAAEGISRLSAFDEALRVAGIGDLNLVRMSSVLPPGVTLSDSPEFRPGDLIPVAYGNASSPSDWSDLISAAVAVAIPENPTKPGIIMESSHRKTLMGNESAEEKEAYVRNLKEDTIKEAERMARDALERRGTAIKEVLSTGTAFLTDGKPAAVFAGLVIFNKSLA